MFQAKEGFLDRVEQTFILFRKNFLSFSIPFLAFNFVLLVIIPYLFGAVAFSYIPFEEIFLSDDIEALSNMSLTITFLVTLAIFLAIVYLFCLIPLQLGLFKSIQQALHGEIVTSKENIFFGASRLRDAFRTYWYIFAYVMLIPALIFIVGGILLNIGLFTATESTQVLTIIGGALMGISIIMAVFYMIYRGVRSTFGIVSALDKGDFTKENFQNSLNLTIGNWRRVFGNFMGVTIIGSLVMGMIGGIGDSIAFFGNDWSSFSSLEGNDKAQIQEIVSGFGDFNVFSFINSIIKVFLNTVLGIFVAVFTYIFFKRLEGEYKGKEKTVETKERKKVLTEAQQEL